MIVVHVVATWPYQKTRKPTRKFIRYWKVAALQERGLVCTGIAMTSLSRSVAWIFPTQIGIQVSQVILTAMKIAWRWWTMYLIGRHHLTVRLLGDGMMLHAHLPIPMSVNSSHKPNWTFLSLSPVYYNQTHDTFSQFLYFWISWFLLERNTPILFINELPINQLHYSNTYALFHESHFNTRAVISLNWEVGLVFWSQNIFNEERFLNL